MPGNMPYVYHGPEVAGQKALYFSKPEYAHLTPGKEIAAGYGVLQAGTVLAENLSAAGNVGKLVPYVITDHLVDAVGRCYVLADVANAATTLRVAMEDSYRFVVGDDLIIVSNSGGSPAYNNLGAITAIDRTTSSVWATITFTTALSGATFTIANKTAVYVETGASGKYSTAKYVLDQAVDTGVGSTANGALSSVILGNAVLNKGALVSYDTAAKSDLSAVEDGNYVYIK